MGGPTAREKLAELSRTVESSRGLQGFPSLDDDQLARAERETVVANVTPTGSGLEYKVAARVFELPVEALYLAIADAGTQRDWVPDLEYSEVLESGSNGLVETVYQGLSSSLSTDEWVTLVTKNRALYEESEGGYWEIWWNLLDDDATTAWISRLPDGRKLSGAKRPNGGRGSWVLVPLDDTRTYVEYATFSDIGWRKVVVKKFGDGVLRQMLDGLGETARRF